MPSIIDQRQDGPQLDFCILGPPKSGKSGLRTYLQTHPRVFMLRSEPNFYADDINTAEFAVKRRAKNRQAYCELFADAADGQLLGEMSGAYLFSEQAIPNILKDSPDARFIVFLRNPVDMAHSSHANLLRHRYEDESSFQKAWELQDARAAGERIPAECKEPKILLYRQRCSYAAQIERLFQWVPRERILVHVFEEFFSDPRAGYQRTLAFLGLPDDGRMHFERVSEHAVRPSQLLYGVARRPPFPFNHLYGPLKRAFNAFGFRPGSAFFRWSVGKEKISPMDPSFRRRLEAEFRPDIARLEAFLGRDLDVWRSN